MEGPTSFQNIYIFYPLMILVSLYICNLYPYRGTFHWVISHLHGTELIYITKDSARVYSTFRICTGTFYWSCHLLNNIYVDPRRIGCAYINTFQTIMYLVKFLMQLDKLNLSCICIHVYVTYNTLIEEHYTGVSHLHGTKLIYITKDSTRALHISLCIGDFY